MASLGVRCHWTRQKKAWQMFLRKGEDLSQSQSLHLAHLYHVWPYLESHTLDLFINDYAYSFISLVKNGFERWKVTVLRVSCHWTRQEETFLGKLPMQRGSPLNLQVQQYNTKILITSSLYSSLNHLGTLQMYHGT